jgi:DNA polymerase III epsilon subunit-like protein
MYNNFGGEDFRYNRNQRYITIDFETENLNLYERNRPWQVAAVFSTGFKIDKVESKYVMWPDLNVGKGAAIATGFDFNKVSAIGKDPKSTLEWLDAYIYNPEYKILWFNGLNFDIYIHNIWRKELGFHSDFSYVSRSIDVNTLVKAHKLGVKMKPNDNITEFQYRFTNFHQRGFKTNLTQCCKDFNIPMDESKFHDATYDTEQTLRVFEAVVKAMDI